MDEDGFIVEPATCDVCGLELLEVPHVDGEQLSLRLNCMVHGTRLEWLSGAPPEEEPDAGVL